MLIVLVLMVLLNKIFFSPTAAQLTVYMNHHKSKGEEIPSWRNVALSSATRLLLSWLPITILTSSVQHAFLKCKYASQEKKVHQRCEVKHWK